MSAVLSTTSTLHHSGQNVAYSLGASKLLEGVFIKGLYILKVLLNGEQTLLENIYGPNRDNELVAFYLSLLLTIVKKDFDTNENIIMGGDFNCPLKPTVQKRGGNLFPRQSVMNSMFGATYEN